MIYFKLLIFGYCVCGCIYWLVQLFISQRVVRSVPLIEDVRYDEPVSWPKLSVIITARNEADSIKDAVESRLEDDYPNLEIILIDDRSDDGTSEIADSISKEDQRVKVIHVNDLPEAWLGKLYAMYLGEKQASGDWLLFSDADVHVRKGTLKRVVSHCSQRKLDHLTVFPDIWSSNFLLDILYSSIFLRTVGLFIARNWLVEDENSEVSAGCGAFNFVRKSAFERSKGFEWLKLELADDVALGQMLKESGAKCSVINGRGYVGLYFYRRLKDLITGAERVTFANIGNFSFIRLIVLSLVSFLLEVFPFAGFLFLVMGMPFAAASAFCALLSALLVLIKTNRWMNRKVFPSLFLPVGALIASYITIRAGYLGRKRGGIYWRGTFYSSEMLKKGMRLKLI